MWDTQSRLMGSPQLCIVAASAPRACEILRALSFLSHPEVRTAKLFARHLDPADTESFLENHFISAAVGTPRRFLQVVQAGSMLLDDCRVVLFDMGLDVKRYHVLSLLDTAADAFELYRSFCRPCIEAQKMRIGFL